MTNKQPQLDLPEGHPNQPDLPLPEKHEELPSGEHKELLEGTHKKVKGALEYEGEGHA